MKAPHPGARKQQKREVFIQDEAAKSNHPRRNAAKRREGGIDRGEMRPEEGVVDSLILTEPLAGMHSQALGLAERAGLAPDVRALAPHGVWARVPARWWPNPVQTVSPAADGALPKLLIGCGGVAAAVLARLRRERGHIAAHIQHPRMDPRGFDLIVVQPHDRLSGTNVVITRTALHRVTQGALAVSRARWAPVLGGDAPLVSVLIGGSNGRFRLDAAVAEALAAQLAGMMRADGVRIALTPSRRTAPAVVAALRAALEPLGASIWNGLGDNPYFGLLACADAIIATNDSVSMISEAVATDVPVLIASLPGRSRRIAAFTDGLLAAKRVRFYAGRMQDWACTRLDDTDVAAERLRALAR